MPLPYPTTRRARYASSERRAEGRSSCTEAVAECHMLPALLHGEERKVWGDAGYQGQTKAIKQAAPHAQDMTCRRTKFKNYVDEL